MEFTYEVTKHPMPVNTIKTVMAIEALTESRCKITWNTELDGDAQEGVEATADQLKTLYLQGISDLEVHLT